MKRENGRKGRILTNEELKSVLGGRDSLPPNSGDSGSGPKTDARAVVIEDGSS
jgi:hypothetical protein